MKEQKDHQKDYQKDQQKDQVERLDYDDVLKQKSKRRNHFELQKKDKSKEGNRLGAKKVLPSGKNVNLMKGLYDLYDDEDYDDDIVEDYEDFQEE